MPKVIVHNYSKFSIHLPESHVLPETVSRVPLYDRFLPHLGSYIYDGSVIIDVGANCGDTLASMFSANQKLKFICIDADDIFFPFLVHNSNRLKAEFPDVFVETIQAFVGIGDNISFLDNNGSTSRATNDGTGQKVFKKTLDEIVSPILKNNLKLSIIKIDVDGLDNEVIDSAEQTINESSPMLFFEADYRLESQYYSFLNTLDKLSDKNYSNWLLLDNYGEIILSTTDIDSVKQMFSYIHRQNKFRTVRTIGYYDVLVYKNKDRQIVNSAVNDFLSGMIRI
jgi:FkbM family methyltransferase